MTIRASTAATNLLDALAASLRACDVAPDGVERPAAILWTDPDGQWRPLLPALTRAIPELVSLGEYGSAARAGPAIWLRCVIDRSLEPAPIPADRVPIVYLPGVGRQRLRAGDECPREWQSLVELMYRGALWLQRNGQDWTVTAFLTSPQGLGLDVARDAITMSALARALPHLATIPLVTLRDKRLEAEDFDRLLSPDVVSEMLQFIAQPQNFRVSCDESRWNAFCGQSRARFGFDPTQNSAKKGGELLAAAEGGWVEAWRRFEESPQAFPGVAELLSQCRPQSLLVDKSHLPSENAFEEGELRKGLEHVAKLPHADACAAILQLEKRHGSRRRWVWARLGLAPLAETLEPLAIVATQAQVTLAGASPSAIAERYAGEGWKADAAAWQALALARPGDEKLIGDVVRALTKSWLNDSACAFQGVMERSPLPSRADAVTVDVGAGECLVFADGLRFDVAQVLAERLEAAGCRVRVGHRWAALPTVTATAKPAVTPAVDAIVGKSLPEDFAPVFAPGTKVDAKSLRDALERRGMQLLGKDGNDAPDDRDSRGWVEMGEIDNLGHKLEAALARQIDTEIERLVSRIQHLLDGGWKSVRVVTDHGWLLLPGGLPKVDLPKHLTASRWARCATIQGGSTVSVPTARWHWNTAETFATAPGIACFNKSPEYAHGGLSIQECLTPDLVVERAGDSRVAAAIQSIAWHGFRCHVEAQVSGGDVRADLRADLRLGHAHGASVAKSVKPLEADGGVSLVLLDDAHAESQLFVVLIDPSGAILAESPTRIGESS